MKITANAAAMFIREQLPKLMLVMKLVTILLIAGLMHASANTLAQKITLSVQDQPLEKIVAELKKQSGYYFFYNPKDIANKKASLYVTNATIDEALEIVLKNQLLMFKKVDNTIVLSRMAEPLKIFSLPARITVKGIVLDNNGKALQGASVEAYMGKTKLSGTVTDAMGVFILPNVDEKATMRISFTGYKSHQCAAVTDLGIIQLIVEINELNVVSVVVNTGYQSLSRERSAGSYSKPDMKIVTERSTSMNILQRLDGQGYRVSPSTMQAKVEIPFPSAVSLPLASITTARNIQEPVEIHCMWWMVFRWTISAASIHRTLQILQS